MNKHTPGPWWWNDELGVIQAYDEYDGVICLPLGTIADSFPEHYDVIDANRRLLAAAPDLLAALDILLAYANEYSDIMAREFCQGASELGKNASSTSVAGFARAAIAIATGEST